MISRHGHPLIRFAIRLLARPRLAREPAAPLPDEPIYVLAQQSLSDLAVLELICADRGWPAPTSSIRIGAQAEPQRVVVLNRPAGPFGRNTMRTAPRRLACLLDEPTAANSDAALTPVQVFWGRTTSRERSLVRLLFAEHWAATSRFRRLVNLLISRKHIIVDIGEPLPLREATQGSAQRRVRRAARLLRVRLRQQKVAALGPDFSHRRTFVSQILASPKVRNAIEHEAQFAAQNEGQRSLETLRQIRQKKARRTVLQMAANMSYPTIFLVLRVLSWFWRHIYDGIEVNGLERIATLGRTHTLVYLPSHRSHIDYLLLSYLLFQKGLMLPHIAAGENMNMPLLGRLLKQGGAFYMPRSFQGKPTHAALFSEYLYQVYRRGHAVEFFAEGGRSRTGRLLPARIGLLKFTIDHARRGLPRPLALVPVYVGYEKLIEAVSYLKELRGTQKRRESLIDLLRSLKLIRQNFGRVAVNFGEPLPLDDWLAAPSPANAEATRLGREMLMRINDAASINPVNLVALVMLCTPRLAIAESGLARQIDCYRDLLHRASAHHDYRIAPMNGAEAIEHVARLGMLNRETQRFGNVVSLPPASAVLMTWYRNNTAHALALPSLIACLLEKRQRPLARASLLRMAETVYPYLARELHARFASADTKRWLRHLVDAGLLREDDDRLAPPPDPSTEHYGLHLLAGIARPFLERNYIVLSLLADGRRYGSTAASHSGSLEACRDLAPHGRAVNRERGNANEKHRTLPERVGARCAPSRSALLEESQRAAQKVARIQGIDAPEFFDKRLFDGFLDQLLENGAVIENGEGGLTHTAIIDEVLRVAQRVIDPELRYALLSD